MSPAPAASAPLSEWLRWLETLHPRQIELGLDRVSVVAARLGVQQTPATTLTIAGTNGKGTSARLAASILGAEGHRVGLYTSPHLLRYNERIEIAGQPASDAQICSALSSVNEARGDTPLTFFEAGTLAALLLFLRGAVDVQVLEVGLGGRLDAVNLVDADVSLLTSVGVDHVAWLGPDREAIGFEKAHIFRPGRPAICGDPSPPDSVLRHARSIGADLERSGVDFGIEVDAGGVAWSGQGRRVEHIRLPVAASASLELNLPAVLAALNRLPQELRPSDDAVRTGVERFSISGRFEQRGQLLLDVAHNVQAAQLLARQIRQRYGESRLHAVVGMLEGKDVQGFFSVLAQSLSAVYCISLAPPRGMPSSELLRLASAQGIACEDSESIESAIKQALAATTEHLPVLVTGSFLTVEGGLRYG